MSIIRSPRRQKDFTILDNVIIRDPSLSFKARGLLAYLLSMPDNWRTTADAIARNCLEGRDAIRSGLAELEAAGYLQRHRKQDRITGRWSTVTIVYDRPQKARQRLGITAPPETDYPTSENPSLIEELTTKDGDKEIQTLSVGNLEVCGLCDGTSWTVDEHHNIIRCDCPGGVWAA
jgi:hypothetical protein